MSARTRARLDRITKSLAPRTCPVCEGRGGMAVIFEGEEEQPLPRCRRCGLEAQTVVRFCFAEDPRPRPDPCQ